MTSDTQEGETGKISDILRSLEKAFVLVEKGEIDKAKLIYKKVIGEYQKISDEFMQEKEKIRNELNRLYNALKSEPTIIKKLRKINYKILLLIFLTIIGGSLIYYFFSRPIQTSSLSTPEQPQFLISSELSNFTGMDGVHFSYEASYNKPEFSLFQQWQFCDIPFEEALVNAVHIDINPGGVYDISCIYGPHYDDVQIYNVVEGVPVYAGIIYECNQLAAEIIDHNIKDYENKSLAEECGVRGLETVIPYELSNYFLISFACKSNEVEPGELSRPPPCDSLPLTYSKIPKKVYRTTTVVYDPKSEKIYI